MALALEGFLECSITRHNDILRGGWKRRWFVLSSDLVFFSNRPPQSQQLGSIPLSSAEIGSPRQCGLWRNPKHPAKIEIRNNRGDVICLKASSADEMQTWANALRSVLAQAKQAASSSSSPPTSPQPSASTPVSSSSSSPSSTPPAATTESPTTPRRPPGVPTSGKIPSTSSPLRTASPARSSSSASSLSAPSQAPSKRVSVLVGATSMRMADIFDELDGNAGPLDDGRSGQLDIDPAAASSSTSATTAAATTMETTPAVEPVRVATIRPRTVSAAGFDSPDETQELDLLQEPGDVAGHAPTPQRYTTVIELEIASPPRATAATSEPPAATPPPQVVQPTDDDDFAEFGAFDSVSVPGSSGADDEFGTFDSSAPSAGFSVGDDDDDFGAFGSFEQHSGPAVSAPSAIAPSIDVTDLDAVSLFFADLCRLSAPQQAGFVHHELADCFRVQFPEPCSELPSWLDCHHSRSVFEQLMAELLLSQSGLKPEDFEAPAPDTPFLDTPEIEELMYSSPVVPDITFVLPTKPRASARHEIFL